MKMVTARPARATQRQRARARKEWVRGMTVVGERLALAIEKRKWSAAWTADVALLSPTTVTNILNGVTRFPTMRTVYWLAVALRVDLYWLLGARGSSERVVYGRVA